MKEFLKLAIDAAVAAGKAIFEEYYRDTIKIISKEDQSPLTIADQRANEILTSFLIATNIPIISEENKQVSFEERKNRKSCWIVDPLDGTKEFIKRNGELTVNIALVEKGQPVLGVIFAPALNLLYFGEVQEGKAYKAQITRITEVATIISKAEEIRPCTWNGPIKVVTSRSPRNQETLDHIQLLKKRYGQEIEIVSRGSSLKVCLVAEGSSHVYPRYAPTMEWETAAGQAICEAVGLQCLSRVTGENLRYNRRAF